MKKKEIDRLRNVRDYPQVSITLPTHRTFPDFKKDKLLLDGLLRQAGDRLRREFKEQEAKALIDRLHSIAAEIDHQYNKLGLALFAGPSFQAWYRLPFSVPERVVVDKTFLTRDLVFALNRSQPHWVLTLSEKSTRLFEAVRSDLEEVKDEYFPMENKEADSAGLPRTGRGIEPSDFRDDNRRRYFRKVDSDFHSFWRQDPRPLVLVGVERHLSMYRDLTRQPGIIAATVEGNFDQTHPNELGKLTWNAYREARRLERKAYLDDLESAIGQHRYASALGEVWRAVKDGRGHLLLVEEDYHQAARLDDSGYIDSVEADPTAPGVIDDAVDDLIEMMLDKGGRVVFLENGDLETHRGIALITRY